MFDSGSFSTSAFSVLAFDFGDIPTEDLDADGSGHARHRERMRQIGFLRKDEEEAVTVVLTFLSMLHRRM